MGVCVCVCVPLSGCHRLLPACQSRYCHRYCLPHISPTCLLLPPPLSPACLQVLNEDIPLPPAGQFSEEFRDFCRQCLQKNPYDRPPAEKLLSHPFILMVRRVGRQQCNTLGPEP